MVRLICCGAERTSFADGSSSPITHVFDPHDTDERDDDSPSMFEETAMFAPPWVESRGGQRLQYGPTSPHAFTEQRAEWEERRGWHPYVKEDSKPGKAGSPHAPKPAPAREGAAELAAFVAARSHEVPRRELEVYTLFFVTGLSHAVIGRRLGLASESVRGVLKSLRRRAASWRPR